MRNSWSSKLLLLCVCLTCLSASACSSQRVTYLPNGQKAYAISCRGALNSWQSCLVHAGRICGTRGYDAIRSEEYDRELLFACKTP
jgi:hypothetical protein